MSILAFIRSKRNAKFEVSAACLLALLAALLILPAQRFIETHGSGDNGDTDILLFSSPGLVKKMALGYTDIVADFYWMRTIQYCGRFDTADKRKVRYKNLYTLLDITTTLNPDHIDAYRTGSFFLAAEEPLGTGQPEEALKFLDKGLRDHPDEWQFLYDKGFVYYWHLQDFEAAGETWMLASKNPDAPEWLPALAAASITRGGDLNVAIAIWQERYMQSTRDKERDLALNRLLSFKVAQDIWGWQALAENYREKNGAYPKTLQALTTEYGFRYSLTDPFGMSYQYDPQDGVVSLNTDTKIKYFSVPDIYKDSLVKIPPLTGIIP